MITYADYKAARRKEWTAKQAIRRVRVDLLWEAAEAEGLVRFRVVPDDCTDFSWLDQPEFARDKDAVLDKVDRDGVWGIIGEYLVPACPACGAGERWECADSYFGFIGDEWGGSGYDTDIKETALSRIF